MSRQLMVLALSLLIFSPSYASASAAAIQPEHTCASLTSVDLSSIGGTGSHITKAKETTQNGKKTCSVEGKLAPEIGFKVLLPTTTWTGRYLQVGCGGLCGMTSLMVGAADGCSVANANGFVIAGTNMGHEGMDAAFTKDPQKRQDFAFRAQHLTSEAAKRLIEAYYGRPQSYAYFTGCSDGGREALVEAQRYPEDFNGIIAGAAAMNFQVQNSLYHGWQAASNTDVNGKTTLTVSRLPILHKAVLDACDGLDGQKDGIIADPRACHFDPATIQCKAEAKNTQNCLTAAEADAAKKFYEGPVDHMTGEHLTAGQPQFGSELSWAGVFVPMEPNQKTMSEKTVVEAVHQIFEDMPDDFTLKDLTFSKETFNKLRARHAFNDATNPDISAFAEAGGKLILWHGWSDPHISPINTIAYHKAVLAALGEEKAKTFERLYLFPGMYHCSGGEGPTSIDLLTPMMNWVEKGMAPDVIVAHHKTAAQMAKDMSRDFGRPKSMENRAPHQKKDEKPHGMPMMPMFSVPKHDSESWRPVYPYPHLAVYNGTGDAKKAENYHRSETPSDYPVPTWAGSDFFATHK